MAGPKKAWRVDRSLAQMQEWIKRDGNRKFMLEDNQAKLRVQLNAREYGKMFVCTRSLFSWYGAVGGVDVLLGNLHGWETLTQALSYQFWRIKLQIRQFDEEEETVFSLICLPEAAICLAHTLAFGLDEHAAWLAKIMVRSIEDKAFGSWEFTPVPPFMLKLVALWKGTEIDFPPKRVAKLGPYQGILDAWHEPPALAVAMGEACDFHLARLRKSENEFDPYPYNVFPVEILALIRVRRLLNLETLETDHPLMKTNLAHIPEEVPTVKDDLLDQLIAQLKQDFPGI